MARRTPPRSKTRPAGKPEKSFVFGVSTVQAPRSGRVLSHVSSPVSLSMHGGSVIAFSGGGVLPDRSRETLRWSPMEAGIFPSVAEPIPWIRFAPSV